MFNPDKNYYEVSFTIHGTVTIPAHSKDEALEEFDMLSNTELTEYFDDVEVEEVIEQ